MRWRVEPARVGIQGACSDRTETRELRPRLGLRLQYATQITAGAKQSFLDGADWAYTAGLVAILIGATVVFFLFPKREDEERLLARYHAEDTGGAGQSI